MNCVCVRARVRVCVLVYVFMCAIFVTNRLNLFVSTHLFVSCLQLFFKTIRVIACAGALTSTAAGGATSAYDITSAVDPARPWTDQEYEHWMAYSLRPENTLSIPPSIWTRLDLEKRERQRVAGLTVS